jgi:DNA topoisomerase-2
MSLDTAVSMTKTVEERYRKLTQKEHILQLSDTYIGSVEASTDERYVLNEDRTGFTLREVSWVPGLYKCLDELIVNARDARVRDATLRHIKIDIDRGSGEISVYNDGNGIECVQHEEHGVYVPELLFGHLLSSTNFDQNERRVTGGKNGYGAKLTNIFSKSFRIETVDAARKKKYSQLFENNMDVVHPPKITSCSTKPFTRIIFTPDYARFGLTCLTDDMYAVMERRAYDLAACTPPEVTVHLNGSLIKVRQFDKYMGMWDLGDSPRVYERVNDRWEVGVCCSPTGKFNHISFVNGIVTTSGGKHVDYVINQITKKLVDLIATKKKKQVRPSYLRDNLWVFINCVVEDAAYSSQSKENLTTPVAKFGSKCELSDKFIEKLARAGVVDRALEMLKGQDTKELAKTDGRKRGALRGYPKLEDAINAGTSKSGQCTLILCEGDSAKTFALSGLGVVGRDNYGIFPLKGKPLNVREATSLQLKDNAEINAIKAILGLQHGKEYKDTSELRYGRILILTDADLDGSHIKGLLLNMIEFWWPSLLSLADSFIKSMLTPVVKVRRGKEVISFYTLPEYRAWEQGTTDSRQWSTKYLKGLGTSTAAEAREYFKDIANAQVSYTAPDAGACTRSIQLAFDKRLATERKAWLMRYDPNAVIEQAQKAIDIPMFIERELVHFSNADNIRSIPNVCDGFKPSQRKILWGVIKRNLKPSEELKVAALAAAVSEASAYHHGKLNLSYKMHAQKLYFGIFQPAHRCAE